MEKIRTIQLFRNYYKEFYVAQADDVRHKINQVLKMIETQHIVPIKFFKYIEGSDGIYEVRVEVGNNIYRVFSCFDKGAVVVLYFMVFRRKRKRYHQEKSEGLKQLKRNISKVKNKENRI